MVPFIFVIWFLISALITVKEAHACLFTPGTTIGLSLSSFTRCSVGRINHKFILDNVCTAFTIDNETTIFVQPACSKSGVYNTYTDSRCTTVQLTGQCPVICAPVGSSFLSGSCVATK